MKKTTFSLSSMTFSFLLTTDTERGLGRRVISGESMMQMNISFSLMTIDVTDIKENVTNRRDIGITRTLSGAMCGKSFP